MSQGRLQSFKQVWIAIAIPVAIAFAAGLGLTGRVLRIEQDAGELARMDEVTAQARLLVDSILGEIEGIHNRAVALSSIHGAPDGKILHLAELEIRDGKVAGVRQARRHPGWNPAATPEGSADEVYLKNAVRDLDVAALKQDGMEMLRVSPDPQRPNEWLSIAFPAPAGAILVLVDPAEAFGAFKRWSKRSEGGNLRAFMIGANGHVLAHSQRWYVGSDFSAIPLFKGGITELLEGRRSGGTANYAAIDQLPVTAAYVRASSLPVGIVVERAINQAGSSAVWSQVMGQAIALAGILLLVSLGAAWRLSRRIGERAPEPAEPQSDDMADEAALSAAAGLPVAPTGHDVFRIESVETGAVSEPASERALKQELHAGSSESAAIRSSREDKILVSRYEVETARVRDPREVARRMAEFASRLCDCPALFFAYHSGVQAAILQAAAGFDENRMPPSMSFPVSFDVMRKVRESEKRGVVASVTDYSPLGRLLLTRSMTTPFEAWAITGAPAGETRLIGILVVFKSGQSNLGKAEALAQAMRTTGLVYESALLSQ